MAVILIGSFVFNFPRFIDDYAVTSRDGTKAVNYLTVVGANYGYQIGYSAALYYIVVYVVPFGALIFLTERLVVSLKKFYARREHMTNAGRAENELTKTLVVVVFVFMICQVLNPIRRLLFAVLPSSLMLCGSIYSYFTPLAAVGIMLDSSVHFFIYSMCDRRFRTRLRRHAMAVIRVARVGPSDSRKTLAISAIAGAEAGGSVVKNRAFDSSAIPSAHRQWDGRGCSSNSVVA